MKRDYQKPNILIIGNYNKNTGPSIVTKNIKKNMQYKCDYIKNKNSLLKIFELILKYFHNDIIIFSGISKMNIITIYLKKVLKKPIIYIMHGYNKTENRINNVSNKESEEIEKNILMNVDKIICVSEKFCNYMKNQLPLLKNKITYINNGIEWEILNKINSNQKIIKNNIISIGGGMKRKNNLDICRAIEKINKDCEEELTFTIIGPKGEDIEEILKFSFVEYIECMSHEQVLEKLTKSKLYIQNSYFETFGLAPLEALLSGCNLLCSKEVGALSIITNLKKEDIIENNEDIDEIVEKIKFNLDNSNRERLLDSIDKDKTTWKSFGEALIEEVKMTLNDF